MRYYHDAHRAINMVGHPFPCYKLLIELQEEKKAGMKKSSCLMLVASLPVKYYGIVVVDDFALRSIGHTPVNAGHKFLYSGAQHDLPITQK
jgi:hypothetical protein